MTLAAKSHPLKRLSGGLWGRDENEVKAEIAQKLDRPWPDIEADLFTDIRSHHRLVSFEGYADPQELLNRYNIAQAQALLFFATHLRVESTSDYKRILCYAKLARLLHRITRVANGHYVFDFTGPASFLRETRRYGAAMAQFLPSLLRCPGWKIEVRLNWRPVHEVFPFSRRQTGSSLAGSQYL